MTIQYACMYLCAPPFLCIVTSPLPFRIYLVKGLMYAAPLLVRNAATSYFCQIPSRLGYWACFANDWTQLVVFTVTQQKNKIETIQRQKLWISDIIEDKQINHLSKSQVCAAHHLRVICRNFPRKFIKLSMETPYLCPSEGHKHGRRDVRENIWNLILLLIATTFGSWSIILLHKQHLVHWECSIWKNGKERPFLNQNNFVTALSLIPHTVENSNIQNALFLKRRAQPSWKFAKRYIFNLSYT